MVPKRIFWLVALFVIPVVASRATVGGSITQPNPLVMRDSIPLILGDPIAVNIGSNAVEWKNGTYAPLHLNQVLFHLDNKSRLTATLGASVLTLATVDYDVHAAVFDAEGRLLGTAKTTCQIEAQEIWWYGHPVRDLREVKLDFGVSNSYGNAKHFALAISDCDILIPEQRKGRKQ